MQQTADVDAKTTESPMEITLVCGSSCSCAAVAVLAADATMDADAVTISAEITPVCGSSYFCSAAAAADSNVPLFSQNPRCNLYRGFLFFITLSS